MDAINRRRRATEESAEWWTRLQADDLDRPEREQFVDWLRESHVHVAEMLRVAQVHGALESFKNWAKIETGINVSDENVIPLSAFSKRENTHRNTSRRTWLSSIAAVLCTVIISTLFVIPNLRGQVIETERGERREMVLDDGSTLQIDPESRLRVKYDSTSRKVFLDHGRALFRVNKSPNRPFLVMADDTVVRAIGTAFAVERQQQNIVVTVSEGKVAVSSSTEEEKQVTEKTVKPNKSAAFLGAGQQLTVPKKGIPTPVRAVDSNRELAWAEGRLIFEKDPVSSVIEQFNRYNRIQLHVTDPALINRPISGVFNATDPESFVSFIQTAEAVTIVRENEQDIRIAAKTK